MSKGDIPYIEVPINGGERKTKSRCLSLCSIFLSLTAIILVFVLVLVLYLDIIPRLTAPNHILGPQANTARPIKEERTQAFACIACAKLLRHPENVSSDHLLNKLDREVKDGTEECCAYSSEQITALFESIARLNDPPELHLSSYNVSDFKFSAVSTHKRLYPKRIVRTFGVPEFPKDLAICEFKPDDPQYGLEHQRGVDITEDHQGLKIKYGGLYYLYASIQFRPQSRFPCSRFPYKTFDAYIERISRRTTSSQNILRIIHTCCENCVNTQETGFTGGVFILEPGDVIRVKVTGFELVYFQPHTSFAGLAMLGSPDSHEPAD